MEHKEPLKIVIFGATGRTGIHCVRKALEQGHAVVAIARDPAAIVIKHPLLNVVQGDVLHPGSFINALQDVDAVISCIGVKKLEPTILFSQGITNIIDGMQQHTIKRIICQSAAGIEISPLLSPFYKFLVKYILQRILKHVYVDTRRMEKILKESRVTWTIVRPPRLLNKPGTGKYRFAINDWLNRCIQISREDVALFIIDNINNPTTFRKVIEVAE